MKILKKALVSSILTLALLANPAGGEVNNSANAKTKPTIKMYGSKNYTVYTGESLKVGKVVAKYKGKKLAAKRIKVTVKNNEVSYPTLATKIKNNKAVTFASSGTYNVTYKATSPVGTTKTATRTISVVDEKYKDAPKSSDGLIVLNDDLSKYADYETITVNGQQLNIVKKMKVQPSYDNYIAGIFENSTKKNTDYIIGYGDSFDYINDEYFPFKVFGKYSLKNEKYNYTNNVLVKKYSDEDGGIFEFLFVDENGNLNVSNCIMTRKGNVNKIIKTDEFRVDTIRKNGNNYYQYCEEDDFVIAPPVNDATVDGKKLILKNKTL